MSESKSLHDLVGADLSRFMIAEMFGVYSRNELECRCGPPTIFKDEHAAKDYAARGRDSLYGHELGTVLVLTDGRETYLMANDRSVTVFQSADEALADREMALAAWTPPA
jgi:hypothetical protein